jgi:hypothetical protein
MYIIFVFVGTHFLPWLSSPHHAWSLSVYLDAPITACFHPWLTAVKVQDRASTFRKIAVLFLHHIVGPPLKQFSFWENPSCSW